MQDGSESVASEAAESSVNEGIYQDLLNAIMEHRLLAGTKLVEERLCEGHGRQPRPHPPGVRPPGP
jgi:DNA-binding GntR family transcriptional regulator